MPCTIRAIFLMMILGTFCGFVPQAAAQFDFGGGGGSGGEDSEPVEPGPRLGNSLTQRWKAGMVIAGGRGMSRNVIGTAPVPINWPEQEVKVLEENITPPARVAYRVLDGGVRQMVVKIPALRPGMKAEATVTLEVTRYVQLPPENTENYEIVSSRDLPRRVRKYLAPSPYIESNHRTFRKLFSEITEGKETDWEKIEAIYQYVRENVQYKEELKRQPIKGAMEAHRDGDGDCEDMTALFIAICRAGDVPARTVWVPEHCYAEFYLQSTENGKGYWFPCQVAGSYAFGGMPDLRLILQKGDNFRVPEYPSERRRYVPEDLSGVGARPRPDFIRELLSE